MAIKSITSFKESPFNSFQTGTVQTVAQNNITTPAVAVAPAPIAAPAPAIVQAPQVQAPATAQVTPAQAQASQTTANVDKTDINKILAIGAVGLGAAALGVTIIQGKQVKGMTEAVKDIDKKVVDAVAEAVKKEAPEVVQEATSEGGQKVALKILGALGFALGGKEVVDIINGLPKKNENEVAAETEKIGKKIEEKRSEVIKEEVKKEITAAELGIKDRTLSGEISTRLQNEAKNRMHGNYTWNIENPNPWMVTSEVFTFVKEGGLAEVAGQLPNAFNTKFKDDPNKKMTVVTPLYIRDNAQDGTCKLKKNENGTYTYTGAVCDGKINKITLTKEGSEFVKVYKNGHSTLSNEKFDIYKGTFEGTDYIFIANDKYFNIDPQNKGAKSSIYGTNKNGVGETERFALFSKATVELMKKSHEKEAGSVEAPNMVIANDWHACSMLPVMRYTIPTLASKNEIKEEIAKYFDETPVITVAHNALLQGSSDDQDVSDRIVKTLLEEYEPQISTEIDKTGAGNSYPLSTHPGNYNPFIAGVNLADRLVPVSENYAHELAVNEDMSGSAKDACLEREGHTLMGIVNGYDKTKAEPSEKMMEDINKVLNLPEKMKFEAYAGKAGDEAYQIKQENKKKLSLLLNHIINNSDAKTGSVNGMNNLTLYKPDQCEVPAGDDFVNTPVICDIGRMVEQKGFDYFAEAITNTAKYYDKKGIKPVFIVMGSGDSQFSQPLYDAKDKLMKTNPDIAKRIFIFNGYNGCLRDAIYCGSDFAAIPSKWEPCGLTQMEAMAKGTIPVVLASGGLKDTVIPDNTGFVSSRFFGFNKNQLIFDGDSEASNAIVREHNNGEAFSVALGEAIETFASDKEKIKQLSINDMAQDFSWDKSGSLGKYIELMQTGALKSSKKTAA